MVRHLPGFGERAVTFQVIGDVGCPHGVIADARLDACALRVALYQPVGVLLRQPVRGAGRAPRGAEQRAVSRPGRASARGSLKGMISEFMPSASLRREPIRSPNAVEPLEGGNAGTRRSGSHWLPDKSWFRAGGTADRQRKSIANPCDTLLTIHSTVPSPPGAVAAFFCAFHFF